MPAPLLPATHRLKPAAHAALAVCLALGAGLATPAMAQTGGAQALDAVAPRAYDIPAGPLGQSLAGLAVQAGIALSFDHALTEQRSAPRLAGTYPAREAFARLLAGSGLELVPRGDGSNSYTLRRLAVATTSAAPAVEGATQLPTVQVTAAAEPEASAALQAEGLARDGYRASTATSVGALGAMPLLDAPFSISVVPRELIQNVQAQSTDDIYRINPSTRTLTAQGTGWTPVISIRGFQTSDSAEDGLRRPYNHAAVIEDKERVEVLNGLTGFLYGAAAPAGMVNYVYKRPTRERLANVALGNYGGSQAYVHADLGGPLDAAGNVAYRLNVVRQDGGTAVDDQKIDRSLVSAALDWRLTDRLLLELNAVYNNYQTTSPSAYWYFAGKRGPAPDASRNWSQPWIHDEFDNTKLTGKLSYRLNERVTLRGAYTRNEIDRPVQDHTMNSATETTYRQLRQRSGPTNDTFDAAQLLADVAFDTGPLAHKLTLGYYSYSAKSWSTTYAPHTGYVGPYPLSAPTHVPEFAFPANTVSPYYSGRSTNRNLLIGDQIRLNEQWSVLAGINRSSIASEEVSSDGSEHTRYDQSRTSPSLSVVFKPAPWISTYASYIEGLEQGGRAPEGTTNAGTDMPPMVSRQKELGVKAEAGGMLLAAAVFDIEKAYEFLDGMTYTQSGRQNHKGVEFSATGKPTRDLTVLGGVTLLDTDIRGGTSSGKEPMNVAKTVAKVYAEYSLPVPGLTLTGGIYYTGRQWANAANSDTLPAYTTADLGLRYATQVAGQPLTLRLNVSNLANKNYWLNSYYLGAPRSVAFSAQVRF